MGQCTGKEYRARMRMTMRSVTVLLLTSMIATSRTRRRGGSQVCNHRREQWGLCSAHILHGNNQLPCMMRGKRKKISGEDPTCITRTDKYDMEASAYARVLPTEMGRKRPRTEWRP